MIMVTLGTQCCQMSYFGAQSPTGNYAHVKNMLEVIEVEKTVFYLLRI
jgi:hypothetical protein